MEDTSQFVEKLNENEKNQKRNKKRLGNGHPEKKLPNKQH